MKIRAMFALTMVGALLMLLAGCSQDRVTNPENIASDDQGAVVIHSPQENLAQMGKSADSIVPDSYIVQFTGDVSDVPARVRRLADKYGFEITTVYEHAIKGFPARIPAHVAENLRLEADVLTVVPDRMYHVVAQSLPTGVDRIDTELNPFAAIDNQPTGVDVDIAIIDTGIDFNNPELNVVDGVRILNGVSDPNFMDDFGHGTHVAGTAAAIDDSIGVVGVAPGARLWGVKVLNSFGFGTTSDIIAGLDWVTARAADIEVVNMSIGGTGWDGPYHDAVANCVAAGVVVVVAAGNGAVDVYGADGALGTSDDVIPAAFPEVATISAYGDSDGQPGGLGGPTSDGADDSFASFSNYSASVYATNPVTSPGMAIDLTMPGVDILSTIPGGGHFTASGTSMACPHAVGLFALYIAEHGRPTDAAGVYAVRQAVIDAAVAQTDAMGLAVANDPDGNLEPLGFAATSPTGGDVAILNFTGPATVNPGDVLVMNVTLGNVGIADVTTPFDAYIYVQNTGTELARHTIPGLAVGSSVSGQVQFTVPAANFAAAVPPGVYTIVCTHDYVDANPANDAASIDVELLSAPQLGTVVINATPDSIAAPWTLAGPAGYTSSGNGDLTINSLAVGDYTLTWGAVAGFTEPALEMLTLVDGGTVTFNGVYTAIPLGSVVINPDPDSLNAPWSLTKPDSSVVNGNGDVTMVDMAVGDYTITWGAVAGYTEPASELLTLADGATVTFNGVYTTIPLGSVVINPDPDSLNAPWSLTKPDSSVVNGNGDVTMADMAVGDYTITWGAIAGWVTPTQETLTLVAGGTITFNGVYTAAPAYITVNPDPDVLSAPWTLTGPSAFNQAGTGDTSLSVLDAGDYTLTWGLVAGYIEPAPETLAVAAGDSVTFNGLYVPVPVGNVLIDPNPNEISAPWDLEGPDFAHQFGNGDVTLNDQLTGSYTLTWLDVPGYNAPAAETLNLNEGQTIIFAGNYTAQSAEALGLYFDVDATQTCTEGAFLDHVPAYLIYTDPSIVATRGFECGIDFSGGATYNTSMTVSYPLPATDVGTSAASEGSYNYIVGYSTPLPTSAVTVMATLDIFYLDFNPIDMAMRAAIPSSSFIDMPMIMLEDFSLMDIAIATPVSSLTAPGGCVKSASARASMNEVRNLYK